MQTRALRADALAPSLHGFRKAFTLAMLGNGADLVSISRLLGHGRLDADRGQMDIEIKARSAELEAKVGIEGK